MHVHVSHYCINKNNPATPFHLSSKQILSYSMNDPNNRAKVQVVKVVSEVQAGTALPGFPFLFPDLVLLVTASTALVRVATKASQALHAEEGHVLVAVVE
jgi:hypothetical protein